jgi:hypothetical protein
VENKDSIQPDITTEKNIKKPIWQEIQEEISKFPKNIFMALVTTLILSVIAALADVANVTCWPKYFVPHESTLIRKEPYHLGDIELSIFQHPPPQLNPFVSSFRLCRVTDKMFITLTAIHVDPDAVSSPTSIYLNGQFVDYLNYYFQNEIDEPLSVEIPISKPEEKLVVGDNYIMIISGADYRGLEYGTYNTDDFEFSNLEIKR